MLDVLFREETLLNVIKSVTRNGRSIVLTAFLALVLVYLFSIVGFLFFKDDFLVEADLPTVTGNNNNVYLTCVRCNQFGHEYFIVTPHKSLLSRGRLRGKVLLVEGGGGIVRICVVTCSCEFLHKACLYH